MNLNTIATLCAIVGSGSLINFFVQRYFSKRDEATRQAIKASQTAQEQRDKDREEREKLRDMEYLKLREEVNKGLDTIRLLSYARVAEESDRLIQKGYATPVERRYIHALNENYKNWGWNGDMKDRMTKVSELPYEPQHFSDK